MAYVVPVKGPKGKYIVAYAVIDETGTEIARFRIQQEGKGYWRTALNLARTASEAAQ
jgi:hypothetical protein